MTLSSDDQNGGANNPIGKVLSGREIDRRGFLKVTGTVVSTGNSLLSGGSANIAGNVVKTVSEAATGASAGRLLPALSEAARKAFFKVIDDEECGFYSLTATRALSLVGNRSEDGSVDFDEIAKKWQKLATVVAGFSDNFSHWTKISGVIEFLQSVSSNFCSLKTQAINVDKEENAIFNQDSLINDDLTDGEIETFSKAYVRIREMRYDIREKAVGIAQEVNSTLGSEESNSAGSAFNVLSTDIMNFDFSNSGKSSSRRKRIDFFDDYRVISDRKKLVARMQKAFISSLSQIPNPPKFNVEELTNRLDEVSKKVLDRIEEEKNKESQKSKIVAEKRLALLEGLAIKTGDDLRCLKYCDLPLGEEWRNREQNRANGKKHEIGGEETGKIMR